NQSRIIPIASCFPTGPSWEARSTRMGEPRSISIRAATSSSPAIVGWRRSDDERFEKCEGMLMGQPAAKKGDLVIATDTHIVMVPSPGGPVPTPMAMPFNGVLDGALSSTVKIDGKPAAVDGSTSSNTPPHIPAGGPFQRPPS